MSKLLVDTLRSRTTGSEIEVEELVTLNTLPSTASTYPRRSADGTTYEAKTPQEVADEIRPLFPQFDFTFATVAEMTAATWLTAGMTIRTLEHTSGYGYEGGNLYKIVAAGTGTADSGSYITLDNGLQAMGLFPNGVYAEQFGAAADDSTNDDAVIQAATDYLEAQGGGDLLFASEAYRADEVELKPGVSWIGKTWKKSASGEGLYTRITSQRSTAGNCFHFNVGGVAREWMGRIENIYLRYSGAAGTSLLRVEHAYAISTKNLRLLGANLGDGLILSDVFDGSMEDTLITNFDRTATITNSGAIDNSNNLSFRRFHCETFYEYGLSIEGAGLSQHSNNKLYFYHLKLEGRPGASGVANLKTTGCNDIFIYGGHASITAVATPPATYSFFDIGDNTRGFHVFGMQVRDNGNTNAINSVVKTSGTVEGVEMFLSVRQDGPAMTSGLIHYESGSADEVAVHFNALSKNASTAYALHTIAPTSSYFTESNKHHGNVELAGDPSGQERAMKLTRSDIATAYEVGRMNAAGNFRIFRDGVEVFRIDANEDISAMSGFLRSIGAGTGGFIAQSPDGTFYKIQPPNGGGAASWVAV